MKRISYLGLLVALAIHAGETYSQVVHERMYVHTDRNYYQTGELIWFRIYNVDETKRPSALSSLAYVELLDSTNRPVLQTKVPLDSGSGNGSLVIDATMPTGRYTFRCYTNWMKNFGPECFFAKEMAIVNAGNGGTAYVYNYNGGDTQGNLPVDITTSKNILGKREKVTLTINSTSDADVSVSVYRLDSLIAPDPSRIYSWLNLAPEFKDPQTFTYPPEYRGHFVTGRVISGNTRMPVKNVAGYLTVMDNSNSFYNAIADDKGNIAFFVNKLNAADSIIIQTHSYYNPDDRLQIGSPFSNEYAQATASSFIATDRYSSTVLEQSISAQATSLYYEDELNTFAQSQRDSTPFYTRADVRYLLDNYTRFSKLEDVFREYVRPVGVSQRRGAFHLSVYNANNNFASDVEPLVIVDGLPVFNTNTLFAYDPLRVKSIDVVTSKYFKSGVMFPGIIDLTTYRRKADSQLIDPNATVLHYEIVQKQRLFHSPDYSHLTDGHLPDFRTTLYWNPSVEIKRGQPSRLEFYTGDQSGNYYISVQGISGESSGGSHAIITVN